MLSIKDLHVSVEDKAILRGLSLDVRPGEVHAIMGPNGSGKSTLSATLAGREDYEVTGGTVEFKGKDLLALSPEDRAGEGIFMAFQYPVEIPGVSNQFFLQTALNAVRSYRGQETLDRFDFQDLMEEKIALLKMPEDLLTRSVNVGFSGGEKKRNDILQMAVLEPELCILDESDSGLDIDALKMVPTRIYAWAPYLVLAERSCYSAASSSSETSNSKSLPGRMALSTMPTSEPTAMPDSEMVTPPSSNTMAPAVLYAMPSESTSTSAATSTLRLFWKSTWFSMRLRTPTALIMP